MNKGTDDSDVGSSQSTHSTSESMIEVIQRETRRLKNKICDFRETSDNGSVRSTSSRGKVHPGGIMTVRTLKESMSTEGLSGRTNKYKIRRRALKRSLHSSTDSVSSISTQRSVRSSPSFVLTDSTMNYRVSFNRVIIREYPQIPGVNPSISNGCPLTIDWYHVDEFSYNIDTFETARIRRNNVQMRMPADYRFRLLRSHGHSWREIRNCTKEANIVKKQRRQTNGCLDSDQEPDKESETLVQAFKKLIKIRCHKKKLKKEALKGKAKKYNVINGDPVAVSLKSKEINYLNISQSKSASCFDITLDLGKVDAEFDTDDEEFADDDNDIISSDEIGDNLPNKNFVTDKQEASIVKVSSYKYLHCICINTPPSYCRDLIHRRIGRRKVIRG